jgi:hypothetical protein
MQHKCSTYITHWDYTVNMCTRLKQSIPRDRYVAMYACNIHMSTTYTAYSSNGNHTNTQSVIHMYSWFNHGCNQELFSQQSSFRLQSLTCLMLYYTGPICNLHTVISMQSTKKHSIKASKGRFPVLTRSYRKSLRVLVFN